MPWDIAISNHGDLIFAANRDLEYVEGTQLLNQRIINRLRIQRGSWIFNRDSSLGSDLDSLVGKSFNQQINHVPMIVQEALVPMEDEIQLIAVDVVPDPKDPRSLQVVVEYSQITPDVPPDISDSNTVTLLIPIAGV